MEVMSPNMRMLNIDQLFDVDSSSLLMRQRRAHFITNFIIIDNN